MSLLGRRHTSATPFPWGKLERRDDGSVATHSLIDHMTDVSAVMFELCKLPGIQRALECTARRSLDDVDHARLAVLAFLHDIGKANTGFQRRYWRDGEQRAAGWNSVTCGHGPHGWNLFAETLNGQRWPMRIITGLPLDHMDQWGDAWLNLLHASISHHGRPVRDNTGGRDLWQPVAHADQILYDPAEACRAMGEAILTQYPDAFITDAPELPDTAAFSHLFAGLVQFADWLGSDTRPGFFPYSTPDEIRADSALHLARKALAAIGLTAGNAPVRQAATHFDFSMSFDVPAARPMQAAMANSDLGPIVVLEAETGSGKTEAALWRFLHLWRTGKVDALYFALPTRVAATQLYERVRLFVQRTWRDEPPVVVRALPGSAAANGQSYQPLPNFQVLWHDAPQDSDAERRWAAESPKRYLAAQIAVGTIDQALLGALQIKHAHLRHALLSRSLLVIDEVHASDAYMTRLTEHLLQAHLHCGGHALLLSATLGAIARSRYLALGTEQLPKIPALTEAINTTYPAISHPGPDGPGIERVKGDPREKSVHWQTLDCIDNPDEIATLALKAAAQGARVLVVRNTVSAAVATLSALEQRAGEQQAHCLFMVNGASTLHHGRFSRQDRILLDGQVEVQIGKNRHEPAPADGLVIIGTQTLEQSLDIDADLLISDLCPMDVLLQRVGRLHRHLRKQRPAGCEEARAWILTPPNHDLTPLLQRQNHGLGPIRLKNRPMGGIYIDLRVLEATRRLIDQKSFRRIPAENRMLVEQATHGEALDAIAREMGESWIRFGQDVDGLHNATSTVANLHALDFSRHFGDLFPEDQGIIGSRLGAADRLVNFDPACMGPFGQEVRQLRLPHHLAPPELDLDAAPTQIEELKNPPGVQFTLGERHYQYTRFGLELMTQ